MITNEHPTLKYRVSIKLSHRFELSDTLSIFISRNDQSFVFNAKMRMLWEIHHLCEFQALTDQFLIWKWMVSDNLNLSDNYILILYKKISDLKKFKVNNLRKSIDFY